MRRRMKRRRRRRGRSSRGQGPSGVPQRVSESCGVVLCFRVSLHLTTLESTQGQI